MRLIFKSLFILLLAIPALLVVAVSYSYFSVAKDRPVEKICEYYADPLRVKVGAVEFAIPAVLDPVLSNQRVGAPPDPEKYRIYLSKEKNSFHSARWYCQNPGDPPIEVDHMIFHRHGFAAANDKGVIQYPLLRELDLKVSLAYASAQEVYCKWQEDASRKVIDWHSYDQSPEFLEGVDRKGATMPNGSIYYTSDRHRFFGGPLFVECQRAESISSDHSQPPVDGYHPAKSMGRSCRATVFLADHAMIALHFYDKQLPPKIWPQMFDEAENLFRDLTQKTLPDANFTGCATPTNRE